MKVAIAMLAAALIAGPGIGFAQSCATPIVLTGSTVTGDTCSAANELGTLCIFAQSPGNDIVYTYTQATPFQLLTVALTNNTPAWNAAMVVLGGPCNGNTVCDRAADANGPGENETIDTSGLADGSYFLIVTESTSDTSCGSYSLTPNSTPVTLQSFDVT